ncbi:transcription initiation factor TFIID subunit 12-like isoform X2 [Pistacia vera]|uniref:transcription initiation factor TFIID subunit 12-like isoform X2 n=1 Tax=Pistacia vera TaxID=55513 RepID=UPI001262FD96|nr:transcription initiation factor TFIID subunit 12-like isoform X2 [Pistacia vera]
MDQQQPPPPQTPTPPTTTAEPPVQPPPPQQQESPSPLPSTTSTPPTPTSNPNPNSNQPQPPKPTLTPQPRPTSFSRPWQQQQQQQPSHFSHFSSLPSSPSSSPSSSASAPQRGGIALGVPAPRPAASSSQPTPSFSASFGQQFGSLGRTGVNVPDSLSNSSPLQARQQVQGIQGMGMIGSLGSGAQLRPGGISVQHHQQRPTQQSSLRPPPSPPSSQPPATQNFQGQGLMRVSPVGSPGSTAPNASQSIQSLNQPWLSSGSQGKPPLPPPSSYRPQLSSPSMQQRVHIPQQHVPLSTTSQQQHVSSVQPQQPKPSHQPQESYGQQFPSSRVPQSLPHQQQISRAQTSAVHKPSSLSMVQPITVQQATQSRVVSAESDESNNQIVSKRSINELVNQIITFGCSLAKHRKSDTLEAKDILLHVERNWNMTLPGFSCDEIKTYRKPLTNDIHKERLAVIKKSVMATELTSTKTSAGQAAVNSKSNLGKIPANIIGST